MAPIVLRPRRGPHRRSPGAATDSPPARPGRLGVPPRLPPALGPNDAAARGQLGPAPERPSRRAGRLRPPRGAPPGAREPPWAHHSPLGRDQKARRGNGDSEGPDLSRATTSCPQNGARAASRPRPPSAAPTRFLPGGALTSRRLRRSLLEVAQILAGARTRRKEWKDAESRGAAPETPKPETQRGYAGFSFHPHTTWDVAPSDQPPTPAERSRSRKVRETGGRPGRARRDRGRWAGLQGKGRSRGGRGARGSGGGGEGISLGNPAPCSKLCWSSDVFCHCSVISNRGNTSFGLHNGSCPKYYFVSGAFVPSLAPGKIKTK